MIRLAVSLLFVSLVLTFPASAAKPPPGAGDPLVFVSDSQPPPPDASLSYVEQQSPPLTLEHRAYCNENSPVGDGCVYNPTECAWTADSRVTFSGVGDVLPAGYTATARQCLIADGMQHINGINVQSPSPDLVVTINFEPQNVTFTLPATRSSWTGGWENSDCVVGPFYSMWEQLPSIPDSHGGVGMRTDITVTVTNPTSRRIRDVSAQYQLGSSEPTRQALYCQGGDTGDPFTTVDGATWERGIGS